MHGLHWRPAPAVTSSEKINRHALIRKYRPAVDARWHALEQRQRQRQHELGDAAAGGVGAKETPLAMVARVLGVAATEVALDLTLAEQGADSLAVLQLTKLVGGAEFATVSGLTVRQLLEGGLSATLANTDGHRLEADVAAFRFPLPEASPIPVSTRRVLLTGAAGFFGQALLDRICERSSSGPKAPRPFSPFFP